MRGVGVSKEIKAAQEPVEAAGDSRSLLSIRLRRGRLHLLPDRRQLDAQVVQIALQKTPHFGLHFFGYSGQTLSHEASLALSLVLLKNVLPASIDAVNHTLVTLDHMPVGVGAAVLKTPCAEGATAVVTAAAQGEAAIEGGKHGLGGSLLANTRNFNGELWHFTVETL